MDRASSERVGEQSGRRRRLAPKGSFAGSAPSPSRSRTPVKKPKQTKGEFYAIKAILQEKEEQGRKSYLIDWADHPQTGETYDHSWVVAEDVTAHAVRDWEKRKRKRDRKARVLGSSQAQSSNPNSQPIRPTKRRRTSNPDLESPSKKPRRVGTAGTARFSVSQESVAVKPAKDSREIKDSYEEEESSNQSGQQVCVLVPQVGEQFDRNAYHLVQASSSEPSQKSQQSQPYQHSQSSAYSSNNQFKTPKRPQAFIWDEEISPVVPDSQEPGSSSYKLPDTLISKSTLETAGSPSQTQEGFAEETPSRSSASASKGTSSKPQNYSSEGTYQAPNSSGIDSSKQVASVGEPSTGGVPHDQSQDVSEFKQELGSDQVFENTQPLSVVSDRLESSVHGNSPQPPVSSDPLPVQEFGSRESARILTRSEEEPAQDCQPQPEPEADDLQFQTQIPFSWSSSDELNRNNHSLIAENAIVKSTSYSQHEDQELNLQSKSQSQSYSNQSLAADSTPRQSLQHTQKSTSSSEPTWQAAQVVSPFFASPPPTQLSATEDLPIQPDIPQSSRDKSTQESAKSTPNQLDQNSLDSRSASQVQTSLRQSPKHSLYLPNLADHPLENVILSIELEEQLSSSSPPPRPSPPFSGIVQFPDTYAINPARRPATSSNMVDDSEKPLSVAEMLKRARAKAERNAIARQDAEMRAASSTPMSIPSTPAPAIPLTQALNASAHSANQMLPARDPAATAAPPATSPARSPQTDLPDGLQILPLGPKQFIVPLSLNAHVKSLYTDEMTNAKKEAIAFLHHDDNSTSTVKAMNRMIDRLELICDHQDLIVEESATQDLEKFTFTATAKWAENISTKCIFLIETLSAIRDVDEHVVVLARPGRMVNILESCFRHREFRYRRLDQPGNFSHFGKGSLKVTLVPTDFDHTSSQLDPATLVVAFDSTFKQEKHLKSLRGDSKDANLVAPILHLVIVQSVEHLELCIESQLKPLDRTILLVSGVFQIGDEIGKLRIELGYLLPDVASSVVAKFIEAKSPIEDWPLLPMPGIEGIEAIELSSRSASELDVKSTEPQPSASITQSYNISSPAPSLQLSSKRPFDIDSGSESLKRQRLTLPECENGKRLHDTSISETGNNLSDGLRSSRSPEAQLVQQAIFGDDQTALLMKKISDLEKALQAKNSTEAELRQHNRKLEAQCTDFESSIQAIQPKYQEALNDRGHFEHETTESLRREEAMRKKHDGREQEITKLRNHNTELEAELSIVRTSLLSSSIPEVAEMSKMREELGAMKTENERLQKRIANMNNELEYMRGNYQNASSAAAEANNELSELKEENKILKRKASENAVRIHEIQASNEIKEHLARIDRVEAEKAALERDFDKKCEELRTVMNGRRGTRGASVPKSPRMTTMSPSTRASRVIGANGSRGNSPAPVEPIRGMFTGDALFPNLPRWPNHLTQ